MRRAVAVAAVLLSSVALPQSSAARPQIPSQPRSDILQLVSQTPVVEPDADLTIRLRVTGAPAGAQIRVEVRSRIPTRSDFNAVLSGKVTRPRAAGPF